MKQQANFTTSKQSCTKPAPLAITTPHAPLVPLHRLHKTQFNTISTETVTAVTVKQQANFTTSKQSYTKPAPLALNTPHAPLPPLHNLQKTQCNAQSTETVATETVKQQSHSRQVQSTEIFPNKKGTDTVPFGVIFRKIVKQTKTVLSRFAL